MSVLRPVPPTHALPTLHTHHAWSSVACHTGTHVLVADPRVHPSQHMDGSTAVTLSSSGRLADWHVGAVVSASWSADGSTYVLLDTAHVAHVGHLAGHPLALHFACVSVALSETGRWLLAHSAEPHVGQVLVFDLHRHHGHHLVAAHGVHDARFHDATHLHFSCDSQDFPALHPMAHGGHDGASHTHVPAHYTVWELDLHHLDLHPLHEGRLAG